MSDAAAPPDNFGVIVAGMHRSSTSLVTSIFSAAGFWTAPDMLEAGSANPKGYYEDKEMHFLHRRLIEAYDMNWAHGPRLRELRGQELAIPESLEKRAARRVEFYRGHSPWVWKNPRATLFLEEWARRFPEAIFVICVRRPDAVVDSLLRRKSKMGGINGNRIRDRIHRPLRGFSVWQSYNMMALRFVENHPDRAIVVRIPEDLKRLQEMSGQTVIEDKLLRPPRARVRIPGALAISCRRLYARLAARADVERLAPLMAAAAASATAPDRDDDAGAVSVSSLLRLTSAVAVAMSALPCLT